jgi:hypothetical protein
MCATTGFIIRNSDTTDNVFWQEGNRKAWGHVKKPRSFVDGEYVA